MEENEIKLISVRELFGESFFIPEYQRGYKWKPQNAIDFLNDLEEFVNKDSQDKDTFYSMQPLAVRKTKGQLSDDITLPKDSTIEERLKLIEEIKKSIQWEVIDGQQRLTTIKILLSYLGKNDSYTITYATRDGSKEFLENINHLKSDYNSNSDFYHMYQVYEAIVKWFEEKDADKSNVQQAFRNYLIDEDKVQFIWYDCGTQEDAIAVFTRLNKGKIGLTNAELIKAILLNVSSGKTDRQREIANEWDEIERTLQNDEFWLFLHDKEDNNPTRIDFIFEIIQEQKLLGEHVQNIGNDKYKTFRYIDAFFQKKTTIDIDLNDLKERDDYIEFCWEKVRSIYQAFLDWYNDLIYYHYIGYLIAIKKENIPNLYEKWHGKKSDFQSLLISKVKDSVKDIKLDQVYEMSEKDPKKTECKPVLLLHNIQTIINQNKVNKENNKFKIPVFYKFPFHQYKNENWDVEHIDSNTANDLRKDYEKLLWLLQYENKIEECEIKQHYESVIKYIKERITMSHEDNDKILVEKSIHWNESKEKVTGLENIKDWFDAVKYDDVFEQIQDEIENMFEKSPALNQTEKNQIWNFTLLDSNTNRGYGNSIFPSKRRTIQAKDSRKEIKLFLTKDGDKDWHFEFRLDDNEDICAFIPPVTRNVFMKYYSTKPVDFDSWGKEDAEAYKNDIENTLQDFLHE